VTLVFRIIALLLLAVLFLPSGGMQHDRILVVALDGASREHIDALASRGELPTLGALRSGGYSASISGGSSRSPREYWRTLLGGEVSIHRHAALALWSQLASGERRTVLVNVPAELAGRTAVSWQGLPGADESRAFVGDSTGRVADASLVTRGRVDWPYREASREIVAAVESLEVGGASEWIEVSQPQPDSRRGNFRLYRLDEDAYYLTPIYRRTFDLPPATVLPTAGDTDETRALYVADDTSFTAASSRILDYLLPHAAAVSRDRAEAARRIATGPWEVLVYYETLLSTAYGVHAGLLDASEEGGVPTAADLADEYRQVDAQIGRMLEAAGPGTLLVVLTREPWSQGDESEFTGLMLVGTDGSAIAEEADISAIAPTLLALAAVDVRPVGPARVLYAATLRHRSSRPSVTVDRSGGMVVHNFEGSADTLRRLGGLEESVSIPADVEVAADADD